MAERINLCRNCEFWSSGEPLNLTMEAQGECRKNPPSLIPVPTPRGIQTHGAFSPAKAGMWCGEHKPRVTYQ